MTTYSDVQNPYTLFDPINRLEAILHSRYPNLVFSSYTGRTALFIYRGKMLPVGSHSDYYDPPMLVTRNPDQSLTFKPNRNDPATFQNLTYDQTLTMIEQELTLDTI
jgi:hypothetical protein